MAAQNGESSPCGGVGPGHCGSASALVCSSPYFVVQKHPRSATRGFGLYATAALPAGFTFHEEAPVFALQQAMNKSLIRACCYCHRVVGDVGLQLRHFFAASNPDAHARLNQMPADSLPNPILSAAVMCPGGCGEAYCSQDCQAAHLQRCHRLLCVGPLGDRHPLVVFKRLALEQTENILLAAEAVCAVVVLAAENVCISVRGDAHPGAFAGGANDTAQFLQGNPADYRRLVVERSQEIRAEAERLFRVLLDYAHERWELLGEDSDDEDMDEDGREGTCEKERASVLETARRQLHAAFSSGGRMTPATPGPCGSPEHQPEARIVASFFVDSSELLSRIAGLFEKNNAHVVVPSPVNAYFRALLASPEARGPGALRETLEFILREKETAMIRVFGDDDDGDDEEDTCETPASSDQKETRRRMLATRFAGVPSEALLPAEGGGQQGEVERPRKALERLYVRMPFPMCMGLASIHLLRV
ncbi:putative histone lysine methyltransferase, SET [Besnoitia besnoiti]|uniref:Putative histone lysine methyltransferase, SET n=1 Tax=Besnoitia besnoiti TaxID=94643 RepID=A0A2A9MLV9_BESBE|nr:putative histone lysine methyltransferase, SET [Besnoitia besnoiti]PFH38274.1 putative histone lysine methyltransferase, SET [Besnoitia besnoiti]